MRNLRVIFRLCRAPLIALLLAPSVLAFYSPHHITRTITSTPMKTVDLISMSTHLRDQSLLSMTDQIHDIKSIVEGISSFSESSSLSLASDLLSIDNIKLAFSIATFLPQIFWLLLILLPNSGFTKKIMGGYEVITFCCLIHFFIVIASIAQPDGTAPMAEFANVFDPSGDPQSAMVGMMQYPNFVSEEWSHVLTWDLFVGRWIWLDGLQRGVFTSHSVLLCNLIGPPGLLLHWFTCLLIQKGLPMTQAMEDQSDQ